MKKLSWWGRIVCGCAFGFGLVAQAQESGGRFIVQAGTDATFGEFTYEDATVDISEEFFNPRLSAEFVFPNSSIAVGVAYAASENTYSLDFDDGEKKLDGDVDVERTDLLPFVRFGQREGVNLRLGYRMFDYEISNARLDETRNSRLTRRIRDGQAEGDMASGLDAELNLTFGESFQFGLMLGATYFKDAEFDWQYRDDLAGGRVERGSVEADAVSLRFGPEIAFRLADELRLYANFVVAGTSWIGSEADDAEDYAGVDVMASVGLGLRYQFGD